MIWIQRLKTWDKKNKIVNKLYIILRYTLGKEIEKRTHRFMEFKCIPYYFSSCPLLLSSGLCPRRPKKSLPFDRANEKKAMSRPFTYKKIGKRTHPKGFGAHPKPFYYWTKNRIVPHRQLIQPPGNDHLPLTCFETHLPFN
jgi:hypothetical protein